MKWITRSHVHVDRVACPWLITRFIDSEAEFMFVPKSRVMEILRNYIQTERGFVEKVASGFKKSVNQGDNYTVLNFIDDLLNLHERTKLAQLLFLSKAFNLHSRVFCKNESVAFQSQKAVPQIDIIVSIHFIANKLDRLQLLKRKKDTVWDVPQDKRFCVQCLKVVDADAFDEHMKTHPTNPQDTDAIRKILNVSQDSNGQWVLDHSFEDVVNRPRPNVVSPREKTPPPAEDEDEDPANTARLEERARADASEGLLRLMMADTGWYKGFYRPY